VGTAAVGATLAVPLVRFALHPLYAATTEIEWSDLGAIDDYLNLTEPHKKSVAVTQRDGWRKTVTERMVYVVAGPHGTPRVLSAVCPHLGCTIAWRAERQQFVSPCHNGVFSPSGEHLSGPPPRSMDELETRVAGGRLQVRYQYFRPLVPTKEAMA